MTGELMIINPRNRKLRRKDKTKKSHIVARAKTGGGGKVAKRKSLKGRKRDSRGRLLSAGRSSRRVKTKSRRPYVTVGRAHKAKRVVRNPRGKGPLSMIGLGGLNMMDVVGGTGVVVMSRMVPSWLKSKFNLPTEGFAGYGVQLGIGLAVCMLLDKFVKQPGIARTGRLLVLSNVLVRLIDDLVFKGETVGSLAGLGLAYPPDAYAKAPLLEYEQLLGDGYPWDTPDAYFAGQYTPGENVEKFKSAF